MGRHEVRYAFEHQILPHLFYEDKEQFVGMVLQDKGVLYEIISSIFDKEGVENPYVDEEFEVEPIRLSEDVLMLKITLPEPEEPILCSDIYLVYSVDDLSTKRYFTVELLERKWLKKSYCLCEREKNGFHCNHGIIPNNTKKREEKIIHLFYGMNG